MNLKKLFGRRSWKWWFSALVCLPPVSAFLIRTYCLWRVPDVVLPSDFIAKSHVSVPDDENAFTYYMTAATLLNDRKPVWLDEAIKQAIDEREPQWDDRLDFWLAENHDILSAYRAAAEIEKSGDFDVKTMDLQTELPRHSELWKLSKLVAVEAQRCIHNDQLDNAWDWYVAGLLSAHHSEEPGVNMCSVVADTIRRLVFRGIASWSEEPALTAGQLRQCRTALVTLTCDSKSARDLIIGEYYGYQNTWNSPFGLELFFKSSIPDVEKTKNSAFIQFVKNSILWTLGQPEVWLRLERQLILNAASQFDQPFYLRRPYSISGRCMVFELENHKLQPGQLTANALRNALENKFLSLGQPTQAFLPNGIDGWCRANRSRIDLMTIVLASQEFHRLHGRLPNTLDELVPDFLESVPFDPMDITGAPIRYRMVGGMNAIVWSVGMDGVDNDGEIRGQDSRDFGYSINTNGAHHERSEKLEE